MSAGTGTLFVVAAPSGAGKSTLVHALLERESGITLSISHTTRAPRPGETPGQQYHFVSRGQFEQGVADGRFLEHAEVHGNFYGTSRDVVETALAHGRDMLLEIDWQGAAQIRHGLPACVGIFILPPSRGELERRLRGRASDSEPVIERRLRDSRDEIAHARDFDFIVVNDVFADAVDDLQSIVRATRLRRDVQLARQASRLADLGVQS